MATITPLPRIHARHSGWLAVLLTPLFMYQADATIVNLAAPSIRSQLGATGAELQLVVGGYLVASASLFIAGARLGQARGYRRVFLLGVAAFGAGSLASGVAASPIMLIAGRVLQGAGGALAIPQILTGIQVNLSGERLGRALGYYSAALAAGAVAGQILGGVIVSADIAGLGWRPIFLVNVPVTVAVLVIGCRSLPADEASGAPVALDLTGMALLAAALLALVLPLSLGRQAGWPTWTWAALAAGGVLLVAFALAQRRVTRRGGAPLLNLHVLARPPIRWGLWPQAIVTGGYYALLFTLALYLQQGLGHGPIESGLTLVPWVTAFGLAGPLVGRLAAHRVPRLAPVGCLLLTVTYTALGAMLAAGDHPEGPLLALLGAGGLGLGVSFRATLAHLTVSATPRYAADISGVFTTSLQVAGAIGVAGFGALYLALLHGGTDAHTTHAFAVTALALAAAALVAAVIAHLTPPPVG